MREFKALKDVGAGVTDRVKKLEVAVKTAFDAQLKDLEDFKSNMMSCQNELVSMMSLSVKSMVADIHVLLDENRKLHATVGSVKCQLEVVEKELEISEKEKAATEEGKAATEEGKAALENEKAALEKENAALALTNNELQEELQASEQK